MAPGLDRGAPRVRELFDARGPSHPRRRARAGQSPGRRGGSRWTPCATSTSRRRSPRRPSSRATRPMPSASTARGRRSPCSTRAWTTPSRRSAAAGFPTPRSSAAPTSATTTPIRWTATGTARPSPRVAAGPMGVAPGAKIVALKVVVERQLRHGRRFRHPGRDQLGDHEPGDLLHRRHQPVVRRRVHRRARPRLLRRGLPAVRDGAGIGQRRRNRVRGVRRKRGADQLGRHSGLSLDRHFRGRRLLRQPRGRSPGGVAEAARSARTAPSPPTRSSVSRTPPPACRCWPPGPSGRSRRGSGPVEYFHGTSASAPAVAGAVALVRQARPEFSPSAVASLLRTTGKAVADPRNGLLTPRIDTLTAVELARGRLRARSTARRFPFRTASGSGVADGDDRRVPGNGRERAGAGRDRARRSASALADADRTRRNLRPPARSHRLSATPDQRRVRKDARRRPLARPPSRARPPNGIWTLTVADATPTVRGPHPQLRDPPGRRAARRGDPAVGASAEVLPIVGHVQGTKLFLSDARLYNPHPSRPDPLALLRGAGARRARRRFGRPARSRPARSSRSTTWSARSSATPSPSDS